MKIAIFIFVISAFFYFKKVKLDFTEINLINTWKIIKVISFLLMLGSFIAILIMI